MVESGAIGIRVLDEITVGQIAAGEVVERPLSVVKELVENALDAGARRVSVSVERGGLDLIEVSDDGGGMERNELPLAALRHATSKLRDAKGLETIATLGFRGEGLASIAAVARVRILSRCADAQVAYAVDVFEQTIGEPEPVGAPVGTRVSVRDLFANVPVRREFLRSASAEFARISTFLSMLSLRYPEVAFSLRHDGRDAWNFPATQQIEQRLAHVFGVPAQQLVALDSAGDERMRVSGFISKPGYDRPDRRMQLLFINGRLLRSTLLAGAWNAGYATFAMTSRQPYGVLFLDLPPDDVDPNVHPTKSDVRLRNAQRTSDVVKRTIIATLTRLATERLGRALSLAPSLSPEMAGQAGTRDPSAEPLLLAGATHPASPLRILAQLDDTYILATDGTALVLVDQHAAHERVAYEAISRLARKAAPGEPLLVPYVVEFSGDDAERFEASREFLCEAGLEVEPFGERSYRVCSTPAGYAARPFDLRGYIEDLSDTMPGLGARERVWATLACHSVVRAGERLELDEMAALLAQLERCENPMHCPHGRPTVVRIEPIEIARLFKRV
ncbi:MAG TPA: DNA mismatch repair endonuclease MutL [Candidatus Baltobacteraceae bacterium]